MKIAVTGATGYIGTRLLDASYERGHNVLSLSRKPADHGNAQWIPYDLHDKKNVELPSDTAALIHLAIVSDSASAEENGEELNSAALLLSAAAKVKAKFIFVSSQTARPDAPTAYGRTKWNIEQTVLAAGGWVVRPGQVYGGTRRALFGTLVNAVRRLPALPAFILPTPVVQPIHVDDLVVGLLRLAERNDLPSGILCLGSPNPVSFTRFLAAIASERVRRPRFFFPIPVLLIKALGLIMGEKLRVRFGIERLFSLFDLPVMETAPDLHRLDLPLRDLPAGMHPSGNDRRRRLIREGICFLTYILKKPPQPGLLRRYVRAVEKLCGGIPLGLPKWVLTYPIMLALFDESRFLLSDQGKNLDWRMDAATRLSEATTQGALRFIDPLPTTFINLVRIFHAISTEAVWRGVRVACSIFIRRTMRSFARIS